MKTHFVEELNLAQVERGGADAASQFLLQEFRRNQGYLLNSRELNVLSPNFIAFQDFGTADDSPEILFWGNQTLFARYFASSQQDHQNAKYALAREYRQAVIKGYRAASEGSPYFDIIGTGTLLGKGHPELIYERLLIPFKNRMGIPYLICYTIERRVTWPCRPSSPTFHDTNSAQLTDRRLSS
ncbi:MAG: hypothetical protein ABJF80_04585 [Marinomonas sp.]|uniref:hypothetical protein n=1 Tax=Roseibium sp. TaxID=1936156 RepID=UPI0032673C73